MTTPPPPQDPFAPEPHPASGSPEPVSHPQPPPGPFPYPPVPYVGYEVDPMTGQPLSDKSRVAAGLLQLIPGACVSVGGIGRLYAGHTTLGIVQLGCSLVAWISIVCGLFTLFIPWVVAAGLWLWFVIDGIVLLAGRPVDGQGRLLRP